MKGCLTRLGFRMALLAFAAGASLVDAQEKRLAADVRAAVDKGVAYLKTQAPTLAPFDYSTIPCHHGDLVLWAMLRADVPPADPDLQKLFKDMIARPIASTYNASLHAMVLEDVDRVKYQWRVAKCAQFLADNQAKSGQWGYGKPSALADQMPAGDATFDPAKIDRAQRPKVSKKIPVRKAVEGPPAGTHSNSAYAALGLRACVDAGVAVPRDVLALGQKAWRDQQKESGGWCYSSHKDHAPYGSMTAAGLGSLAIYDALLLGKGSWKKDPGVIRATQWLAENYSAKHHAGAFEHGEMRLDGQEQYYYWLDCVERAGSLLGTSTFGRKDWHAEGVAALLASQQADGSWRGSGWAREYNGRVAETCFAVLFLTRATRPLETK